MIHEDASTPLAQRPVWWMSSTVRMVAGVVLLVVVWQAAGALGYPLWPYVKPWLQGEDGLLVKSFGFKLVFGLLALTLWWQNQLSRFRSNGLTFRTDVWPQILAGNVAVAVWVTGGAVASAILLGMVL
jgi:hypothetical protein